jgi:hypothetical protein
VQQQQLSGPTVKEEAAEEDDAVLHRPQAQVLNALDAAGGKSVARGRAVGAGTPGRGKGRGNTQRLLLAWVHRPRAMAAATHPSRPALPLLCLLPPPCPWGCNNIPTHQPGQHHLNAGL